MGRVVTQIMKEVRYGTSTRIILGKNRIKQNIAYNNIMTNSISIFAMVSCIANV